MTQWRVLPFQTSDSEEWERVVSESGGGTFLQTRAFLAYHGNRFADRSLSIRDRAGGLYGIIPAAASPHDAETVVSHPGATFGGLLTVPSVTGEHFRTMFDDTLAAWGAQGYRRLVYRPAPSIYQSVPRSEDLYELWRRGGQLTRRTLSACIDLKNRLKPSSRRRRSLQKARRYDCRIDSGLQVLPELWPVVETALHERHGVRPVHSLDEIHLLAKRFPSNIEVIAASVDRKVVAGVVLFCSPTAVHVQYSLSASAGAVVSAMDILIERSIERAVERGARFFDLGISTDPGGTLLNEGLHSFKMEFGAGTVVYDQYEIDL